MHNREEINTMHREERVNNTMHIARKGLIID